MKKKNFALIGAAAFGLSVSAIAEEMRATVVSIHYSVRENDPEKLQRTVTDRVERSMQKLPRLVAITSTTTHGVFDVEVEFEGNATEQDLSAVTGQIEMLKLDEDVSVISRAIEIRAPRLLTERQLSK
jgi:multidrug efflux pump subunit AcrB